MASRREFLEGGVSTVLAALVGRSSVDDPQASAEENADSAPTCDACATIARREAEWLFTPVTKGKRKTFEELMRPEVHDWGDGCEYQKVADHEDVPFSAEDFEEVEYDIESQFVRGILSVDVMFYPDDPVEYISATVEVGETGGAT